MNAPTDVMIGIPWATGFELDDSQGLDALALSVHQLWRFLGLQPGITTEFRSLGQSAMVAYPTSLQNAIALTREADTFDSIGTFLIPNAIGAPKYSPNRWHPATLGCAGKADVTHRRVIYVDCDAERPKAGETNSTAAEKACAIRLADKVERWLSAKLDPRCIGRGDSGNGASLFIAIEPAASTPELDDRVAEFLRRLALKFQEPGAKVDCSVSNPDRLVPLFGSMKRKGPHSAERPQRQTFFSCRAPVARIPLSEVL